MLLAGAAQVHVRIHEGGKQVLALTPHHLGALAVELPGCGQLDDLPAAHEHVGGAVEVSARIEHVGA